jgi:hypothetical protein
VGDAPIAPQASVVLPLDIWIEGRIYDLSVARLACLKERSNDLDVPLA